MSAEIDGRQISAATNRDVPASIRRAWAATFVVLGVTAAFVPGIERRWYTAAILFALVPAQLLWHRLYPSGRVAVSRSVHDSVVTLVIAVLSPVVWHPVVLVYAVGVGNLDRRQIPRLTGLYLIAIGIAFAVVGALQDQTAWLATSITVAVLLALRSIVVDSVWDLVRQAEGELSDVLDSAPAVLHVADPSTGLVTWVSPNIERLMGWTSDEWVQVDPMTLVHPDDVDDFWIPREHIVIGQEYARSARHRHKNGGWVWLNVNSRVIEEEDGSMSMRGHYMDATDLVAAQSEINELASRDQVTGLANRRVLLTTIADMLTNGDSFGLLMLDVDRFKDINDTLGHDFGDEVLSELAQRLDRARPKDLVCRLGGDEFAVLVRDPSKVTVAADVVGQAASAPMQLGDLTVATEVSIGSVVAPRDGTLSEDLLRRGDIAMYQAKRRRLVHVEFDTSMEQTSALHLELSATIDNALAQGQFVVFFQPVVNLHTKEIVGAEGLARWRHPEQGLLSPANFIRLVSLSNAYSAFTDFVIAEAAEFLGHLESVQPALSVSVNISMASLFDSAFPSRILSILTQHGVEPTRLILEITESDIMEEYTSSSPVLDELAAMGVRLSIDDFGTGHSSLTRLVDLPVTEVKIDRRFVSQAPVELQERAVIESILGLADRLRLDTVAEGIETEEQAELVKDLGCKLGQGFLYGRPTEASALLQRLGVGERS